MTTKTYIDPRIDRSQWGKGAWSDEPDKVTWSDGATGLPCMAKRHHRNGHWCGYVGVHAGHPFHGKGYGDPNGPDVGVHGGLTYADECEHGDPATTICHVPEPGEPDDVWWFGFDCHHYMDYGPGDDPAFRDWDATYKDLNYVQSECSRLACQLAV